MSNFFVSLWESVFTPGPTPTLLIATNATFGCLQVVLLVLLFFTTSYHFLVLSVLCGGLWGAINWFAAELQAAKAQEDKDGGKKHDVTGDAKRIVRGKSPEQGSDTETEEHEPVPPPSVTTSVSTGGTGAERRKAPAKPMPPPAPAQSVPKPTGSPSLLDPRAPGMGDSDLLKRRRSLGESSGYISTDSEWEKVSEGEGSGKK